MVPIILYLSALLIVFLLILLVETVVLQLMRWDDFRGAIKAALLMNLASLPVLVILVVLATRFGISSLLIGLILNSIVEGYVLTRLRREAPVYNFTVAFLANLASYLILLLPAFIYS